MPFWVCCRRFLHMHKWKCGANKFFKILNWKHLNQFTIYKINKFEMGFPVCRALSCSGVWVQIGYELCNDLGIAFFIQFIVYYTLNYFDENLFLFIFIQFSLCIKICDFHINMYKAHYSRMQHSKRWYSACSKE